MKFKICINSRIVGGILVEESQTLYVQVSSVSATDTVTIWFLESGNIASKHWLKTSDLKLIDSGHKMTLQFTATYKRRDPFTQSIAVDEVEQEIPVSIAVIDEFPRP